MSTYKEVAELAGFPKAYRAVGNVLNKNPDIKTVPCYRVIKSDGKIGGYKYGGNRKAALLKREGVIIKNRRVISNALFISKIKEKEAQNNVWYIRDSEQ